MAAFLNVCRFNPTLGGTTDWTYSSAVTGYNSPALAGVVNGAVYKYRAESTDLSQWEIGQGAYNTGTGVLARTTVLQNSSGSGTATGQSGAGSKISFSAAPTVAIVAIKEDLLAIDEANSFTTTQQAVGRANLMAGIADLWERVGAEPSLDLLADDIAAMFTTTRASTATYFDADGLLKTAAADVPRVQYNPITRQNEGYLYESGETNLCIRSQELDNAAWAKSAVSVTANAVVAPDGTTTADKLVEDTANTVHFISSTVMTVVSGSRVTTSIFVQAAGRTRGEYRVNAAGGNMNCFFDTTTLVTSSVSGSGPFSAVTTGIEDVGGGWRRLWMSGLSTGITSVAMLMILVSTGTTDSYLGDGTSGLYLWGADLKANAFTGYASSYIPTTTVAVARSVDVPTLATDTSWFNGTEGTLLVDLTPLGLQAGSAAELIGFDDGSTSNHYRIRFGSVIAGADFTVNSGGVSQVDTGSFGVTAVRGQYAFAYAVNDFAFTKGAQTVLTDTSGALAVSISRLILGLNQGGAHRIHRVAYWPKRLTNAQLQLLTAVS